MRQSAIASEDAVARWTTRRGDNAFGPSITRCHTRSRFPITYGRGDDGAASFCAGLAENVSLQEIAVGGNAISPEASARLAALVRPEARLGRVEARKARRAPHTHASHRHGAAPRRALAVVLSCSWSAHALLRLGHGRVFANSDRVTRTRASPVAPRRHG